MGSSTIRLIAVETRSRPEWEEIAEQNDNLSACHLPAWLDSMHEVSGYLDASRLYETRDGRRLLLPLAVRPHLPSGFGVYGSWPEYWNGGRDGGGLLSHDGPVTAEDVRAVASDLAAVPALRIRVMPSTADAEAWRRGVAGPVTRTPMAAQVVDLSGGIDAVWGRFTSSGRRACRRAERRGVVVECDTTGRLMSDFLRLYRRSVDRWAAEHPLPTPVARQVIARRHTDAKMHVVARRLGSRCQVWIARLEGQAVSGFILLTHGAAATYWKGAMDKGLDGGSGATNLLHRCAMEVAIGDGRLRYDLGPSGRETLVRFKASLGAAIERYEGYVFERIPLTAADRVLRTGLKSTLTAASSLRTVVPGRGHVARSSLGD